MIGLSASYHAVLPHPWSATGIPGLRPITPCKHKNSDPIVPLAPPSSIRRPHYAVCGIPASSNAPSASMTPITSRTVKSP